MIRWIIKQIAILSGQFIRDETAREKFLATARNQPWVKVIDIKFDYPQNPGLGHFELDWNKNFVDELAEAGYSGRTDEDVIDQWFNDLCRGVIEETDPEAALGPVPGRPIYAQPR